MATGSFAEHGTPGERSYTRRAAAKTNVHREV
jgi:hypothetical protein